jgi:hypothetical protein
MNDDRAESTVGDQHGAYEGNLLNMTRIGTKAGSPLYECDNCGKKVPENWGHATRHNCGDRDEYRCCEDMDLTDEQVELDTDSAGTDWERKKRCRNCGELLSLSEAPDAE